MAALTTKSLTQIVQSWAAAAQAACAQILDFSVGSVNLAIAEGGAALGLWLQKLAVQVLGRTRFATSFGADADSWGAQFQFTRLPAVAASGQVTFSRSATTGANPALIKVGTRVATADGTVVFAVYADPNNAAYSATAGGYQVPVHTLSVSVPVQATVTGTGGNVAAAAVSTIVDAVSSIESVTNPAAFINGLGAESDAAYKARFPLYLAGLATGNKAAIEAAIANTQQGLRYEIIEQFDLIGTNAPTLDDSTYEDVPNPFPGLVFDPGCFIVVVDDGSGSPSASLLLLVSNAINAVRGFTIRYQVFAPVVISVNVAMTLTVDPSYTHQTVVGLVQTAITNFLNSQPMGSVILPITKLAQIAYEASAGVTNVSQITINGAAKDLSLAKFQLARAGLISVN